MVHTDHESVKTPLVKAPANQAHFHRFESHLGHNRLSCSLCYNISFWPTTYDEIKNKRYNCKIHDLYTGAMYIQNKRFELLTVAHSQCK